MRIGQAYCFAQDFAPQSRADISFDRDYLLYCERGALRLEGGDAGWLLPPSFAAWIPARTSFAFSHAHPVTTCSVLVEPGTYAGFPAGISVIAMNDLTRSMIQHCRRWGPDAPPDPAAPTFFAALLDTCADLLAQSPDLRRPGSSAPDLTRALAHTEAHLGHALRAPDVARAAGLSERQMQRRFVEELGMTWAQALTRLRMIRAVEILAADPQASVLSVAQDCGYASLSAFNRAFRTFCGKTPSQFRTGQAG